MSFDTRYLIDEYNEARRRMNGGNFVDNALCDRVKKEAESAILTLRLAAVVADTFSSMIANGMTNGQCTAFATVVQRKWESLICVLRNDRLPPEGYIFAQDVKFPMGRYHDLKENYRVRIVFAPEAYITKVWADRNTSEETLREFAVREVARLEREKP